MRKKLMCIILASIFCLCGLGMLAGCGEEVPPSNLIEEKVILEIKKAYLDREKPYFDEFYSPTVEDITVTIFWGREGVYVLRIFNSWRMYPEGSYQQIVEGLEFEVFGGPSISVYKERQLYLLEEAYDNQLLTYEDLVQAHQNYCDYYEYTH
jgi:hypothetical protein